MKKIIIFVAGIGLTVGAIYWLCKKEDRDDIAIKSEADNAGIKNESAAESVFNSSCAAEEIHQTKNECVQAVYERHSEASEIMKDAYSNIMEDFVVDFSSEKVATNKDAVIDSESVPIMKELDSISDELEDLLK